MTDFENELFRVDSLDEITREHFGMTCVAAMRAQPEIRGLVGIESGDDFVLWRGEGFSSVQVRNWSGMLTLLIISKNGTWLTSDHIEGMGSEAVIDEAYRRFEVARPYINKELHKAFAPVELNEGAIRRWMENSEEYMLKIKKLMEERDNESKDC